MVQMSLVMRKLAFCICENKDSDQFHGNCEADQHLCFRYIQCSRMVARPSDISGSKQLGPENSSPTSDRLSDVKFGTNLDVLAEITVRENHYWKSDQSQDSLQNDQSTGYRSVSICKVFTLYFTLIESDTSSSAYASI